MVRSSVKSAEIYRNYRNLINESVLEVGYVYDMPEVYKTLMVRMHKDTIANFVSVDESLNVRVYIGSISKGMRTQIVSLLWASKTLLYERPYIVTGNIKVAGL